jgi:hypothetical protein
MTGVVLIVSKELEVCDRTANADEFPYQQPYACVRLNAVFRRSSRSSAVFRNLFSPAAHQKISPHEKGIRTIHGHKYVSHKSLPYKSTGL